MMEGGASKNGFAMTEVSVTFFMEESESRGMAKEEQRSHSGFDVYSLPFCEEKIDIFLSALSLSLSPTHLPSDCSNI